MTDLEVEWVGAFDSGFRKVPDKIEDLRIMPDGKVVGGGDDMNGEYKVTGEYSASKNQIDFLKEYSNTGKGVQYKGQIVGPNFEGQRSVGNQGHQRSMLRMNHEEWRGYFKEERGRSGNFKAYLHIYNNQIYGHGFMGNEFMSFKGEKTGKARVQFLASNLYSSSRSYNCRGEMNYTKGVMTIRGTLGGKKKGQFEMRKYTRDPTDQEAIKHLPPTYKSNATDMITNQIYNKKAKSSNLFKNPKWQEMFNSGPDVLGPNIRMVPIDKEALFTPDTDDVINIENEVNYYRNQRMRKEEELGDLEKRKRDYMDEIRREQEAEKAEEILDELDDQLQEKEKETSELEMRKRKLEEERQALLSQIQNKTMMNQTQGTIQLDQYPQPIFAGGFGSELHFHPPAAPAKKIQEPLRFYKEAPKIVSSPAPIRMVGQNQYQRRGYPQAQQPAQRFQQPSNLARLEQKKNFMRDSYDDFTNPNMGNQGRNGNNPYQGKILQQPYGQFNAQAQYRR